MRLVRDLVNEDEHTAGLERFCYFCQDCCVDLRLQ